jgi:hypothetical protein
MPDENNAQQIANIVEALRRAGLFRASDIEGRRDTVRADIEKTLAGLRPAHAVFPPCADVLLATINSTQKDEVVRIFQEYFTFERHVVVPTGSPVIGQLDDLLKRCRGQDPWPSGCCLPADCVTLCGTRHKRPPVTTPVAAAPDCLKRLTQADVLWLYYMNRMALPEILGALLDDYNSRGRFPVFSDSLEGLVAETMIRLIKTGEASTAKERSTLFLRTLGWKTDATDRLNITTTENLAFRTQWLAFLKTASEYFKYNRLRDAIQATNAPSAPSTATLTSIRDIIGLLKKSFDAFDYGRNASITLSGIVWIIATLGLVRNLRKQLGIPESYEQPYEFIPAAYELLVVGRPSTPSETNRFTLHLDAARYGRRILLDIQALSLETAELPVLEAWLSLVEDQVEGFRAANRGLTGEDVAEPAGEARR